MITGVDYPYQCLDSGYYLYNRRKDLNSGDTGLGDVRVRTHSQAAAANTTADDIGNWLPKAAAKAVAAAS